MSMTDPIADMLTRIRNGSKAKKVAVDVPASNIKRSIAKILLEENFLKDMIELPDNRQGILRIYLKYSKDDDPIIRGLKRLSKPGLRKYFDLDQIKRLTRSQIGIMIMSTSQGIITNAQAIEKRVGGEALFNIW
jgi:small subunit ribosomal protein S8